MPDDHDPGRPHVALDRAVLVEAPVHEVLVVRDGHVDRDHQPARAPDLGALDVIDVLPEHAVVLLVDADGVGDHVRLTRRVVQDRVQVSDLAEAVAAQLQRLRHEAEAPLADVVGRAPEVIGRRIAIRHDHLRQREPMGDAASVEADRVQDEPFAVVEAQPQRPLLPRQRVPVQRERHAVGLRDLDRPQVVAHPHVRHEARHVLAHDRRADRRRTCPRSPAAPSSSGRRCSAAR